MQEVFLTIPYHRKKPRPPQCRHHKRATPRLSLLLSLLVAVSLPFSAIAYSGQRGQQACEKLPPSQESVCMAAKKSTHKVFREHILKPTDETLFRRPPEDVLECFEVPDVNSAPKRFMDYRAITSPSSIQYALQQDAITDEYGFRRYGDYYMIALGTYYTGYECGKVFRITLDTGASFEAITGDVKSDAHTDPKNQHRDGNIVEFIVDTGKINKMAAAMGDMSYSDGVNFSGKVTKIEQLKE